MLIKRKLESYAAKFCNCVVMYDSLTIVYMYNLKHGSRIKINVVELE